MLPGSGRHLGLDSALASANQNATPVDSAPTATQTSRLRALWGSGQQSWILAIGSLGPLLLAATIPLRKMPPHAPHALVRVILFVILMVGYVVPAFLVADWRTTFPFVSEMFDGRATKARLRTVLTRGFGFGLLKVVVAFSIVFLDHRLTGSGKCPACVKLIDQTLAAGWNIAPLILGVAICEEMLFRAFALQGLVVLMNRWLAGKRDAASGAIWWSAIAIQGFLFGLYHVLQGISSLRARPWYMRTIAAPQTWGGMILGYVFWQFGLEAAVLAHATLDATVLGVAYGLRHAPSLLHLLR